MLTKGLEHPHRGTPILAVMDPRGLAIRAVQYHRRQAVDPLEARVTHQRFDAAGRPVTSQDPYLFALAQDDASVPANLSQVFSLSGVPLASDSVDAGWRVALQGAAGQIVERWDGRSRSLTEFDALLRPVAVREHGGDGVELVVERFTYGGIDDDAVAHNLCGQLIRHDDPAGTLHLKELGLGGALLKQVRHFLRDADTPDWPASEAARDALLETGDGATTSHVYSPGAEPLQQTDALGNRQRFAYTVAGQLKNTRLTLVGEDEMTLVSDLHYNASGQIESETAGNRVITRHRYDLADGRLIGLSAHKADGTPLQDLCYRYDATGNVLSLEDAAQPIRYFNNQRIEPLKTYRYDTLDQLIEARGWEAKTGSGGPALPDLPPDPSQVANYTQTYHYDAGGNLLDLVHVGAQAPGRLLTRAKYSNRCLPERNGRPPTEAEIAAGFDANGNLRELQAGQSMEWDLRNQLTVVRPVVRDNAEDDYERYVYDGGGQRVRKLRANQTNARTLISEVRYLPGVEIRSHGGTGEVLHVITASAGSNSVQVLHWVAGQPEGIANNQVRYNLNDHLQSSALELDQNADLISQEWYYPFGGTACFAARSATEAKYKTVRYSGKERDATGLYYYGFRYYAPWLQRWINPDPAWEIDGLNFYRMVRNNPIAFHDPNGLSPHGDLARTIMASKSFQKKYYKNPEIALILMAEIAQEQNHPADVIERAIRRVRKEMGSPFEEATTQMSNLAIAPPKKEIPAPTHKYNIKTFISLYTTTHGSGTNNSAMRKNEEINIDKKEVISELSVRHENIFDGRDGATRKLDIKIAAKHFKLEEARNVSHQLYLQDTPSTTTYYRGGRLTKSALNEYKAAEKNRTVLHSLSFLSVAKDPSVAEEFRSTHDSGLFIIKGFSAASMAGGLSASAVQGSVFTFHADFKVTKVDEERNIIHLTELRGYKGHRIPLPH
jgi:insecticidal toxin complex protein TccC